jgi:hypothetical protein
MFFFIVFLSLFGKQKPPPTIKKKLNLKAINSRKIVVFQVFLKLESQEKPTQYKTFKINLKNPL